MSDENHDLGDKIVEVFEYDGTNGKAAQILAKWAEESLDPGHFEENFEFPSSFEGWADLLADRFDIYTQLL